VIRKFLLPGAVAVVLAFAGCTAPTTHSTNSASAPKPYVPPPAPSDAASSNVADTSHVSVIWTNEHDGKRRIRVNTPHWYLPDMAEARLRREAASVCPGAVIGPITEVNVAEKEITATVDCNARAVAPQGLPSPAIHTPVANGHSEIALYGAGGTFTVPVSINGAITLKFIIDSGAADVSIPRDVVLTLIRTGTIDRSDFLGDRIYSLADGSTMPSTTFRIRSLRVGDREVRNVTASIAPEKGALLLGQSFLRQFGSWSIDNRRGVLVLD
jgi:clan AA aspartic protease (TIGR02281 family)